MSLLLSMTIYLVVGCGEWYLALRRTLACARGEKVLLVTLVFIENLLGLWVLSNFIRTNNWALALCYSAGASAGALIVAMSSQMKPAQAAKPATSRVSHPQLDTAVAKNGARVRGREETDVEAVADAGLAVDSFRRTMVASLRSAQKALTGAGREWWSHYIVPAGRHRQYVGHAE
jgi:hypothetical protein